MSNILSLALQAMPVKFSSNDYIDTCLKLGMKQEDVTRGIMVNYLHTECNQITRRTWEKKASQPTLFDSQPELTDEMCIDYLKSKGIYEIYKLTKI